MRSAAYGLTTLLDAGFALEVAVPGYLALVDYVLGSVFFDTAAAGAQAEGRGATARRVPLPTARVRCSPG